VPHEAKLAFGLIQESGFDLLALQFSFILPQVLKVGRTGDLDKIGKMAGDLDYAPSVPFEFQTRSSGWTRNQLCGLLLGEGPQEHVGKDVEERGIGNELAAAQFLEVARRAGHESHVIVVGDRPQERVELQIESPIRGYRVEFVEQYDQLAFLAPESFQERSNRVIRRIEIDEGAITNLPGDQREQLSEEFAGGKTPFLLKVYECKNVRR